MKNTGEIFSVKITETHQKCAVGESTGKQNIEKKKIPVFSCEGACIRGEIARLAANIVAKEEPYRRGCHGELLTIPESSMADWANKSDKVVLIDGCFLRCHGRILENLIGKEKLVQYDALPLYKKYTDIFDIDGVPEEERKAAAQVVAEKILVSLKEHDTN